MATIRVVAGHAFEGDSMDARCTRTHTDSADRCPMTRAYLWTAQQSDVGQHGYAGYGALNQTEHDEIRADEKRIRDAAWEAIIRVCT